MFSSRFDSILKLLNIKNKDLAAIAGIDSANISRFRKGSRIPKKDSDMAKKLEDSLLLYTKNVNRLALLCSSLNISSDSDPQKIIRTLDNYLFEGISDIQSANPQKKIKASKNFGERLTISMKLANLSNVQLSQYINVDPSLISRFKSGLRTPSTDSEISEILCHALFDHISDNKKTPDLFRIMNHNDSESNFDDFKNWIFSADNNNSQSAAAEQLLEIFDSFTLENNQKLPSFSKDDFTEYITDTRDVYIGISGIRDAVLRFLGLVVQKKPKEIFLYSDQDMDWMVANDQYFYKWAFLMNACVLNGTKIRIIHNINRSLTEMNSAIKSWLPLYMSGLIEPYYCKKNIDQRFSHTIFLCPGMFCIEAAMPIGMEKEGLYHFYSDELHLNNSSASYNKLLESSHPLISFSKDHEDRDSLLPAKVPFSHIKVAIGENYVNISHSQNPSLSFNFMHPLMIRAFNGYIKNIL